MNFEKKGVNFLKITNKDDKNEDVKIYLSTDIDVDISNPVDSIIIPNENRKVESFQHLPYKSKDGNNRQILYISGQSGSGKSYYAKQYILEYIKLYPKNNIYLFSNLEQDNTLDAVKQIKRVQLNEAFINHPFTIEDFKDALIIMDDCECMADKSLVKKINDILMLILTTGRHTNTYCIITTHITTNGPSTKIILTEANSITLFIKTIGERTLKYVLENYFGLSKKQIEKIKGLNSRWITVLRTYPIIVLSQYECYSL